jgi:hypothetical protein
MLPQVEEQVLVAGKDEDAGIHAAVLCNWPPNGLSGKMAAKRLGCVRPRGGTQ